jgi:hypothetical protein
MECNKEGDASPNSLAFLTSAWSLEAQFQPVTDLSSPAVVQVVDEVMRAYKYAPASEPTLTSPSEVQEDIEGLKFGKAPGPNGVRTGR